MYDSDASNIDQVGHRRWCLNPRMSKVGFASFKGFSRAMWVDGRIAKDRARNLNLSRIPDRATSPGSHFGKGHAWSIALSESAYLPPPAKGVKSDDHAPPQVDVEQNKITQAGKPLELGP